MIHTTRESWYQAAAMLIGQQVFKPAGYELPRYRIGCGFPTVNRWKAGAECFNFEVSKDKTYEIFISPKFSEPLFVLSMLVHELCHTIAGLTAKHQKPFIAVMRAAGMVAPWKGSTPGPELEVALRTMSEKLGPYPHAELALKTGKGEKKGSRLLKVQCPKCGYVARVTRKWIDEAGPPICPTHKVAFKEVILKGKE